MPATSRPFQRLRRRALHWYELGLCAALLAMVVAAMVPLVAGEAAEAVHCGNNQSSTVVIER